MHLQTLYHSSDYNYKAQEGTVLTLSEIGIKKILQSERYYSLLTDENPLRKKKNILFLCCLIRLTLYFCTKGTAT